MGFLESRLKELITRKLYDEGYRDPSIYSAANGFAVFPGSSGSASELINEAKAKIHA